MKKTMLSVAIAATSFGAIADGGVGQNGVALPSNTSFSEKGGVEVTLDNLIQAETAKYFSEEIALYGGNEFRHERSGIDLNNQTIIRSNFDAIYSYGVFDASEGVTISMPEGELYQSVQVFDENHVTLGVAYPGEVMTIDADQLTKGNHVYLFMRTQPKSFDDAGMAEVNVRQDKVKVTNSAKTDYVSPVQYDVESFNKLRTDIIRRAPAEVVIHKGFITDLADIEYPHYHMANTAGWAGLTAQDAFYFVVMPGDENSRAAKCSTMTFDAPELQYDRSAFWSLTAYDANGWVVTDTFRMNSTDATQNEDGSYTVSFNCGANAINNIETSENWNALFRNYLPVSLDSILDFQKEVTSSLPIAQ